MHDYLTSCNFMYIFASRIYFKNYPSFSSAENPNLILFLKITTMKPNNVRSDRSQPAIDKIKWTLLGILFSFSFLTNAQVSINTDGSSPDASAMLEVKSPNRGLLLPRINFASRPTVPATGLAIYQIDNGPGIYFYDGAAWQKMSLAAYDFWNPNGSDIYFSSGRVGIGTSIADDYGLNVINYITGRSAVRGANQNGQNIYAEGHLGVLSPASLGIPYSVTNIGVLGIKLSNGNNGAAVYGWNNDDNLSNYAGLFYSDGTSLQGTNYGLYAVAEKANQNYAGYFRGRILVDGNRGSASGNDSLATVLSVNVNHTRTSDTRAIDAVSTPQPGYGYGVYGEGGYMGVRGLANSTTYSSYSYGVYGTATGTGSSGIRIGVYGYASGGSTNWGSYFVGSNYMSGDLRIGTTSAATGYALSVNGKIACTEVLVQALASWPDYVFKKDYKLMSLDNLEQSIRENGHLPGLPSAQEIESNGLHLGNMQKQVVEKVEELTLYTIEQGKLLKEQGTMLQELKKEMDALKAENLSLKKMLKNK